MEEGCGIFALPAILPFTSSDYLCGIFALPAILLFASSDYLCGIFALSNQKT
jgi:hypothetical protein